MDKWIKFIRFCNKAFWVLLGFYLLFYLLSVLEIDLIPTPIFGWVAIGLIAFYILNGFQTLIVWLFLGGHKAKKHLEERNKAL